jgi:hypothetical protein
MAERHYFNANLAVKPFEKTCQLMRDFFEGEEYYRKNLIEWNAITFQGIIDNKENQDKTLSQCLQILIDKLCKQQYAINPQLRTNEVMNNKLVIACQGVPACRYAISSPAQDFPSMISKLQSSIVAWEKENPGVTAHTFHTDPSDTSETFYTDRRFQNRDRRQGRDQYQGRGRYQGRRPERGSNRYTRGRPGGRCFICSKEECRSWKHPEAEREKAREAYRSKFNDNTKGRFSDRGFDEKFRQYVAECEEEDDEDELDKAFESLVLDIELEVDSATPNKEEQHASAIYFTSLGELTSSEAAFTSNILANNAFTHSVILADCAKSIPAREPLLDSASEFSSYTSKVTSRYGKEVFMGIIVDTGASTKSTAGYNQFQALQKSSTPDMEVELDTSTKGQVKVQFGVGTALSLGTVYVCTPVGGVEFHIVEANTPFLLSLADMDRLRVYYDNIRDVLVTSTKEVPVVRRFGHAFLLSNSSLQSYLIESFEQNPC